MATWEDRLKQVEGLARSFRRHPLTAAYKPRLLPCQPSSIWKLFPRQGLAITFAQTCKEDVHVFALEKENAALGKRIFLVTSYSELWHYYRTYQQSLMHCYEVIPDGAVSKLYFDLEFHRPSNPELDGKAMVSFLIQYVCEKLMEVYGVACSAKDVLNLDSSTGEKFSRHLIFNLCNAAFKDNIHVGRFVHGILQQQSTNKPRGGTGTPSSPDTRSAAKDDGKNPAEAEGVAKSPRAKRQRTEERDLSCLSVKNKEGQESLFVDLGVYTKNRNFRLYKSSKLGKNVAFALAEDNKFTARPLRSVSAEENIFLSSLVCNVSYTAQRILTWDGPEAKRSQTTMHQHQPGPNPTRGPSLTDTLGGYERSPFKEVDDFVLTLVQKDGIQGSVRRWSYFVSEQLLIYDILKYRWCENIGRFHKSNNIMILVDLKEEVWYQKCHDPACKSFRSSSFPLPQEICISYLVKMDEEHQGYSMDAAGNIELQTPESAAPRGEEASDDWGDESADRVYLEALDDVERSAAREEAASDQLLLDFMTDFDSH